LEIINYRRVTNLIPRFSNWGRVPLGGRERFARGCDHDSDILLKSRIVAN